MKLLDICVQFYRLSTATILALNKMSTNITTYVVDNTQTTRQDSIYKSFITTSMLKHKPNCQLYIKLKTS